MKLWLHGTLAPLDFSPTRTLAPWEIVPMINYLLGLWPHGPWPKGNLVPGSNGLVPLYFSPMGLWPHWTMAQWEFGLTGDWPLFDPVCPLLAPSDLFWPLLISSGTLWSILSYVGPRAQK